MASTSLLPKPFSFDLAETAVLRGALQTQREPPTCHWRLKTLEAFPGFCLFQQPQRYLGLWVWGGVEEREASNLAAVERRSSPETLPRLSSSQGWQPAKAERTACPAQGACLVRALHGCRQGAGRCGWPHSQRRAEREPAGLGPSAPHHTNRAPSTMEPGRPKGLMGKQEIPGVGKRPSCSKS